MPALKYNANIYILFRKTATIKPFFTLFTQ